MSPINSVSSKNVTNNTFRKLLHSPIAIKMNETNKIEEGILYGDRVILHP